MRSNQLSYAPKRLRIIFYRFRPVLSTDFVRRADNSPQKFGGFLHEIFFGYLNIFMTCDTITYEFKSNGQNMINKRKFSAEEVLLFLMDEITMSLEELQDLEDELGGPRNQFAFGQKTALVTCLEFLKSWEKAEENGLDFDIEEVFPV